MISDALRVYLDANIVIHVVEGQAESADALALLVEAIADGRLLAATSELSLAEVLVKPMSDANDTFRRAYEQLLGGESEIEMLPVTRQVLSRSAEIRATIGGKLADGIHVAAAELHGSAYFLTEDRRVKIPDHMRSLSLADLPGLLTMKKLTQ